MGRRPEGVDDIIARPGAEQRVQWTQRARGLVVRVQLGSRRRLERHPSVTGRVRLDPGVSVAAANLVRARQGIEVSGQMSLRHASRNAGGTAEERGGRGEVQARARRRSESEGLGGCAVRARESAVTSNSWVSSRYVAIRPRRSMSVPAPFVIEAANPRSCSMAGGTSRYFASALLALSVLTRGPSKSGRSSLRKYV